MNKNIIQKMFATPITIYPAGAPDSMGDVSLGTPLTIKGYVVDEVQNIETALGTTETSNRQVYLSLDDIDNISIDDKISCLDRVKVKILSKAVFKGPYNETLIGVLYIP